MRVSLLCLGLLMLAGCYRNERTANEVVVYCSVDEPYASKIFADFEQQTGIHVVPQYDIESSKSVGLAGKLTAEKDHPRADVWWCSEAFLSVRLAKEGVLAAYDPPGAVDVPAQFRDAAGHFWTGCALRARVLAVGSPPPPFEVKGLMDLADPRLKNRIAISRPTAGATGAHLAALYSTWGQDKTRDYLRKLRGNGIQLLGGNAEVAVQVGNGVYTLGLTDNDDVTDTAANGGKIIAVVPDQGPDGEGTLAMPTTVAMINGVHHQENAKKLIDYLVSKKVEQRLIDLNFARWSVRGGPGLELKAMKVDYAKAADVYAQAQQEGTAILEGRMP